MRMKTRLLPELFAKDKHPLLVMLLEEILAELLMPI